MCARGGRRQKAVRASRPIARIASICSCCCRVRVTIPAARFTHDERLGVLVDQSAGANSNDKPEARAAALHRAFLGDVKAPASREPRLTTAQLTWRMCFVMLGSLGCVLEIHVKPLPLLCSHGSLPCSHLAQKTRNGKIGGPSPATHGRLIDRNQRTSANTGSTRIHAGKTGYSIKSGGAALSAAT